MVKENDNDTRGSNGTHTNDEVAQHTCAENAPVGDDYCEDDAKADESKENDSKDHDYTVGDYVIGEVDDNGIMVAHIYGKSRDVIVYLTGDGRTRWECSSNITSVPEVTTKYEALRTSIPIELSEEVRRSISHELGLALYSTLYSNNNKDYFSLVAKRIDGIFTRNQAKLLLVKYGFLSTIVIISVLYFYDSYATPTFHVSQMLTCSSAGTMGALFSLLQRNNKVVVPLDNGKGFIFLQSLFICILGLLSGWFLYHFVYSEFNSIVNTYSHYNLVVLSFLSGFSERFVPDIFNNLSKK